MQSRFEMRRSNKIRLTLAVIALSIAMASCGTTTTPPNVITPIAKGAAVYSMSNGSSRNAVLAFMSAADGTLQAAGSFETGGKGTGVSIENQGALSLTEDRKFLLVVNPASDDFSLFRLPDSGPQLLSTTPSGGQHPVSISTRRDSYMY
jgi:6-phosphogluconolactonase (cycloisomerase 2 family)